MLLALFIFSIISLTTCYQRTEVFDTAHHAWNNVTSKHSLIIARRRFFKSDFVFKKCHDTYTSTSFINTFLLESDAFSEWSISDAYYTPGNNNNITMTVKANSGKYNLHASSGVTVHPDVETTFQKMSGKNEFRYIIFKIEENEVIVETAVTPSDLGLAGKDYNDSSKVAFGKFVEDVKTRTENWTDCRYAVFDFKFTCNRVGAGISKLDKIVFLLICPDGASTKKKMVYASSTAAIKAKTLGTGRIIQKQVTDESELSYAELLNDLSDKYRDN